MTAVELNKASEKEIGIILTNELSRYFFIKEQIYSTTGKRIDFVLKCKESGVLFGLEIKKLAHKTGVDMFNYMQQAKGYSNELFKLSTGTPVTEWPENCTDTTKLMIFIYPPISSFVKQIIPDSKTTGINFHEDSELSGYPPEYYQAYHPENHLHSNVNSLISCTFNIGEVTRKNRKRVLIYKNMPIWFERDRDRLHIKNYNYYSNR